jgi:outer membrane protein OmpA-like peptidoglycan-associated protein
MQNRFIIIFTTIILLGFTCVSDMFGANNFVMRIDTLYPAHFNTTGKDICPVIYKEGIVFSTDSRDTYSEVFGEAFLDLFFVQDMNSSNGNKIKKFHKKFNTIFHDGPVSFSNDQQKIFISQNVYGDKKVSKNKINRLKIVFSEMNNNSWSQPEEFPYNNKSYSVGHPALSPDGKLLFFTSNMPGGFGKTDIYVSEFINEQWSKPVNLGPEVNTSSKEMFPYVDKHNNLYFSSGGHNGYGKLDIFIAGSIKGEYDVRNLGKEINSPADDFGFFAYNDFEYIMFSSNRKNGKGQDDIYIAKPTNLKISGIVEAKKSEFPESGVTVEIIKNGETIDKIKTTADGTFNYYPKSDGQYDLTVIDENFQSLTTKTNPVPFYSNEIIYLKAIPYHYVTGQITSERDGSLEEGVTIELSLDGIIVGTSSSDANGNYKLKVEKDRSYKIRFWKHGYFSQKGDFIYSLIEGDNNTFNVSLKNLGERNIVSIDEIYYDFNKWHIQKGSKYVLSQLLRLMLRYPDMRLVLSSYADSRGSVDYNMDLSRKRSEAVRNYLVENGIPISRLEIYSYGESKPITMNYNDGSSESLHQKNRRTEIYIDLAKTLQHVNNEI